MLIILPPSETKATGGTGPSLTESALSTLSFPALNPVRNEIMDVLEHEVIQAPHAKVNAELTTSPTMPSILRYTGVLYDALDAASLPEESWKNVAIGSALFGVSMAGDLIPTYRYSPTTKLAGLNNATPKKLWGKTLASTLEDMPEELVLDLRSGAYQQLGPVKRGITMKVVTESGRVVNHWNKQSKGIFTRVMCESGELDALTQIDDVLDIARAAGLDVEYDPGLLTLTTEG